MIINLLSVPMKYLHKYIYIQPINTHIHDGAY